MAVKTEREQFLLKVFSERKVEDNSRLLKELAFAMNFKGAGRGLQHVCSLLLSLTVF